VFLAALSPAERETLDRLMDKLGRQVNSLSAVSL
jgi:hypothetical protein